MTPSDYTIRCDPTTDCRHHLCDGQCGRPLRDRKTPSTAHPGTTAEYGTTGMCWKCHNQATMLQPEDLEDQRHIIMTDEQMISIWYRDPDHWEWLMQRRYRLVLGGIAA